VGAVRRRSIWLVALPAMLAGTEAAHGLAYRLVFPQATLRFHVLAATGHGYLAWLPLVLALAGAAAAIGLGAAVLDTVRGRHVHALPPFAFALLPPLAFALQEVLELSLRTGTFGWHAIAAPTFLPGFALQLPFGLLAYVAARLILRAAVRLGRLLGKPPVPFLVALQATSGNQVAGHGFAGHARSSRGPPLAVGI
jgi:hypothetical protein